MTTAELLSALVNTLLVCGLCVLMAVPVGTLLAVLLFRTNIVGRRWAWIALGSQLAVPLYVFAGGWSAGLGLQGWLRIWDWPLSGVALQTGPGALFAAAAIHALAAIPWVTLITALGLVWTHRGQEEAALLEGGLWQLLRYAVLPKLRIWLVASCLWCIVPVLTEMVVTNLYQVPTVAEQVYLDASRGAISSWTYIASVALCMLPIWLAGYLWWRRAPAWSAVAAQINHFAPAVIPLENRHRVWLSSGVWGALILLVGLPILNLVAKAGWQPYVDSSGQTHYAWQATRFVTTLYESLTLFRNEFYWSGMLAVVATGVAVGLVGLLQWQVRSPWGRQVVALGMLTLIAVPGPLVGMLTIFLLNRSQPLWLGRLYDTTLAAPVLAQQFRLLPLAWLLCLTIQASIASGTWEQARLDGLSRWDVWRRIIVPQTWSRWLAGLLLLAMISVGELSSSILVLPPGVTTLSMRLFEMLHFGMRHQDSGLCLGLLLLGWAVSLVLWNTLRDR